jgi:phospholipid/cholesterol/gamma-HCH transport system ATP-binding protein
MVSEIMVEARGLAVGWSEDQRLLEDASFQIARGEIFGILGGSGCGKSTLLRYLIGLEEPLAGTVEHMGEPIGVIEGRKPRFGAMFQSGALFGSMTVLENVVLPLRTWTDLSKADAADQAFEKLRLVGLEAAADKQPSELSGGMKKRAAIARALALDPPLLFLDEPSAGLDPVTSASLDDLIQQLSRDLGVTVVIVTHELESIFAIIDRVIMLDKETRSIIANGAPKELKASADERVFAFFNPRSPRAPAGKRQAATV